MTERFDQNWRSFWGLGSNSFQAISPQLCTGAWSVLRNRLLAPETKEDCTLRPNVRFGANEVTSIERKEIKNSTSKNYYVPQGVIHTHYQKVVDKKIENK